jgi:AP2-associated kinase
MLPRHPNIIRLFDSEIVPGERRMQQEAYLVLEYCAGGSLADQINTTQMGLPEKQIWEVFYDVCQAVAAMHAHDPPLVHRDIKAENVLLHAQDTPKLCDFGSCQVGRVVVTDDRVRAQVAEDIERYTTMCYRSPEMVDLYMDRPIDEKLDVWALGILLYKLAFVFTPFEEQGRLGIINARIEFPSPAASRYSQNLLALIRLMLTPDPAQRPDVFHVLHHIARIAPDVTRRPNAAPLPATPASPPPPPTAPAPAPAPGVSRDDFFNTLDWQDDHHRQQQQQQHRHHHPPPPSREKHTQHSRGGSTGDGFVDAEDFFAAAAGAPTTTTTTTSSSATAPTPISMEQFDFFSMPSTPVPSVEQQQQSNQGSGWGWASFDDAQTPPPPPPPQQQQQQQHTGTNGGIEGTSGLGSGAEQPTQPAATAAAALLLASGKRTFVQSHRRSGTVLFITYMN